MNKQFNRFIKNALLGSFGIMIVAALLIFSYMDSKDLTFDKLFEANGFYIGPNSTVDLNFLDVTTNLENSSKTYNTSMIHKDTRVEAYKIIKINSTTESIKFVHEDREDIRITFDREVPDIPSYSVNYKTNALNNEIVVDVTLNTSGFLADQDYEGTLTFYVPRDYHCHDLVINSMVASHDFDLPRDVDNVAIHVNFGSLHLTSHQPLETLNLTVNAGDLSFNTQEHVTSLIANVDTGDLSFDIKGPIDNVELSNNIGSIEGKLHESPTLIAIDSNLGDVRLDFSNPIGTLEASVDIGDLDIMVSSQDKGFVYLDGDLVDYDSRLATTKDKAKANVIIEMNLGDVTIR